MSKSKTFKNVRLSVLDLVPVNEGSTPEQSFTNSVHLAQRVESLGFHRYWLAEHHNMPGIASSATSVIIGHIAGKTRHIRVGAGGIMLPNHAPLVVAEQFGTLESLYPGRIDLGLGRAPGTDGATAFALRRSLHSDVSDFPLDVSELENYFVDEPTGNVRAVPGTGLNVPIWFLGSSDFSARLAAEKGRPFAFASHFAPQLTVPVLQLYRENFQPSKHLDAPYAMVGVNIIAADSQEEAQYLATSQQQQFLSLRRGEPSKLQPPVENIDDIWSPSERAAVEQSLDSRSTIVGDRDTVKEKLASFIQETKTDEVIINSQIFDHNARIRSYEIVAELME
ncbi:MAG TPA: LLM class flavin-dependent oxidoreductase [Bacillota bacterium]|nr:LLM class flavin-dependent oxidoreductase [Bacillota bacterium]